MSDSLNVADQTIDDVKYEQSEADQAQYLNKVQTNVSKIMTSQI